MKLIRKESRSHFKLKMRKILYLIFPPISKTLYIRDIKVHSEIYIHLKNLSSTNSCVSITSENSYFQKLKNRNKFYKKTKIKK